MATGIESGVYALVGAAVGGLISAGTTAWFERRRLKEARRFRNHDQRVRTATEYLTAFDSLRRGIRDSDPAYVELARAHANAIGRVWLWFEEPVPSAAEKAGQHLLNMHMNPTDRASEDNFALEDRNRTRLAMKKQLDEGIASKTYKRLPSLLNRRIGDKE